MPLYRFPYDWFTQEQSLPHQPGDKRVRIVRVRKLPDRATQPEGLTRGVRQGDRGIHEISGRQREQKGTRLQSNAKPLTVGRTVSKRRGLRLGTPPGQGELAMVSGHDHLRAALGNRKKRATAPTLTPPDPFAKSPAAPPAPTITIHPPPPATH